MVLMGVLGRGGRRLLLVTVLMAAVALGVGFSRAGAASEAKTHRVSVSSAGTQGNGQSFEVSISADGRFVAFGSYAPNLVGNDTNGVSDVFVYDRSTHKTRLVSVSSAGIQSNGYSYDPMISADGRFVAYYSYASNLVGNDTNAFTDVFVYDRTTHKTRRVSINSAGTQVNRGSYYPSISAHGRFVAFTSTARRLVGSDTNHVQDVFVHDRTTHKTRRVSVSSAGTQVRRGSYAPSISAHGRYVAFFSGASNLVSHDTNSTYDVFVHDRTTHKTRRVSVNSAGIQGSAGSRGPSISADGSVVAFFSAASNLVGNDTNHLPDVFVHDRTTHKTRLVSVSSAGAQANNVSYDPAISADGSFVAFGSDASNLVGNDTNGSSDVFWYDRSTHKTRRVSVSSAGTQSNNASYDLSISADGRVVGFDSAASNLVDADTNTANDVFVRHPLR